MSVMGVDYRGNTMKSFCNMQGGAEREREEREGREGGRGWTARGEAGKRMEGRNIVPPYVIQMTHWPDVTTPAFDVFAARANIYKP